MGDNLTCVLNRMPKASVPCDRPPAPGWMSGLELAGWPEWVGHAHSTEVPAGASAAYNGLSRLVGGYTLISGRSRRHGGASLIGPIPAVRGRRENFR